MYMYCGHFHTDTSVRFPTDIESTYNLLEGEVEGALSPPVLHQSLSNIGLPVTPTDCEIMYQEVTANGKYKLTHIIRLHSTEYWYMDRNWIAGTLQIVGIAI